MITDGGVRKGGLMEMGVGRQVDWPITMGVSALAKLGIICLWCCKNDGD